MKDFTPTVWLLTLLVLGATPAGPGLTAGEPIRIEPSLLARLAAPGGGSEEGIRIRVRLRAGVAFEDLRQALSAGGAVDARLLPAIRRLDTTLPPGRILEVSRNPAVEWIEELPGEDRDRDESDGVRRAIGLPYLAPILNLLKGSGVKVGAWENGHPDVESISGQFHGHDDFSGRIEVMEPSEPSQHATMVAGILAGDGRASEAWGGTPFQWRGVAPGVHLYSFTTTDSDHEAAELLQAVSEQGIELAIQSWGEAVTSDRCSIFGDYTIRCAEFDQAIAGDDPENAGAGGIPVVFSVGNYQGFLDCLIPPGTGGGAILLPGFRTINPPHTAKDIIAVGAIDSDDLRMTVFSSWGPTDDGRIKPDIVAPGSEAGGDGGITAPSLLPPDGYRTDQGTSFAAAAAAGALAILIGERHDRGVPDLPPAAWKALVVQSARDLTDDPLAPLTTDPATAQENALRYRGPDYFYGFGLVWVPGAFALSTNDSGLKEGRVGKGQEIRFGLIQTSAETHRITLAWDDPPGDPAAARALVNDLDLRVEEMLPGGGMVVHLPWVLDPLHPDLPASRGVDHLNNIEQVEFDGPGRGPLVVVVSGAGVTRGPQRFWVAADDGISEVTEKVLSYVIGDANATGQVDISDALTVFSFLFLGTDLKCREGADANLDNRMDIADGIVILRALFLDHRSGWLIGQCHSQVTVDLLDCQQAPPCP
jgi:subtilase family protein